jgi:hypothetical protein
MVNLAGALTVEKISIERMTGEASLVVYGRVLSSYSQWEGKVIYTYTTVRVSESLKGDAGPAVTIKQLGGQIGETGLEVSGSPELKTGEEVVLFLTRWQKQYWIHSIVLGKFTVIREDGDLVAYNDLNNIGLIDPVTRREVTEPNQKQNHFPLQSFLSDIRSYARN